MKIIIPVSSFLLALSAFYLKGIQWSLDTTLVKLYSIDAVNEKLKSELLAYSHRIFYLVIVIAMIAIAIAAASIYNKLCNKVAGIILVIFSVLSFLCSLIRV
jgi:FtsH-binding integral membrane protein